MGFRKYCVQLHFFTEDFFFLFPGEYTILCVWWKLKALLRAEEPVPLVVTSCYAELVTQLSRLLPPALGLSHRLQQHPQGTFVGVPALALSSPSHGAWPSPLVLLPGATKKDLDPSCPLQPWELYRAGCQSRGCCLSSFQPCKGNKSILNPRCATPVAPLSASIAMSKSA